MMRIRVSYTEIMIVPHTPLFLWEVLQFFQVAHLLFSTKSGCPMNAVEGRTSEIREDIFCLFCVRLHSIHRAGCACRIDLLGCRLWLSTVSRVAKIEYGLCPIILSRVHNVRSNRYL